MMSIIFNRHFLSLVLPVHILAGASTYLLLSGGVQWSVLFLTLIGWILVGGFGIALGYHRFLAHRSFHTRLLFQILLTYLGALGAQGSPILWAAIHRGSHHPFADGTGDLHSPRKGWFHAYIFWQFCVNPSEVRVRAVSDLLKDPWLRFLHNHYGKVVWLSIGCLFLLNWKVALYGLCLPMFISMHLDNLVNLLCHIKKLGYRNFNIPDDSVNIPLLGWLNFGGGWHNNHHARPENYNFGGVRWFEFDPSVLLVNLVAVSKNQLEPGCSITSNNTEPLRIRR